MRNKSVGVGVANTSSIVKDVIKSIMVMMMSEKRFKKMDTIIDPFPIWDTVEEKGYNCTDTLDLLVDLLNEQQATIEEYKDFCLNLCKFVIQKGLVDEYREKYGKEYKIITKWWNDE